ncbi:MAG: glycosyltransferase family 2 protein [Polaromonas sp.]|nr:glycosyltransferase family 2 protein [Polaromonas sp.]
MNLFGLKTETFSKLYLEEQGGNDAPLSTSDLLIKQKSTAASRHLDVQRAPSNLGDTRTPGQMIKVDMVYQTGTHILVAGWSNGRLDLGLKVGGIKVKSRQVRVARPDVASHFKLPDDQAGFILVADSDATQMACLTWQLPGGQHAISQALAFTEEYSAEVETAFGQAIAILASTLPPHTPHWHDLIAKVLPNILPCAHAKAFLEAASVCQQTGDCIIVGWVVQQSDTLVWLEDDTGKTYPLQGAYRRFRQDVHDAVGSEFGHARRNAGLVARITGCKAGALIRLKTISATGIHILAEVRCNALPSDPVAAANWLFSIGTPVAELYARVPLVDEPVLDSLIQQRSSMWSELPVKVTRLGKQIALPKVSIVVPLYGRTDFVEHQMLEFCTDPWLMKHAELIYVLDDPKLPEPFVGLAETLHRLYKVPFSWIWGNANRGFSGANNLGVQYANGQYLVFLNSDAFPQQPGWLEALVAVLETRADIGAVGPRLVFADGSIQHAGMEFKRRDEMGIWVNHHPNMGLDPSLDPSKKLTVVPAVTGACLAMRRTDFDSVDGWDTGYLIGDFEDSDLCLKLRTKGFNIGYLPTVQLTHLERQSFKLLGEGEFRARVVVYNAVRHQNRWASVIDQPIKVAASNDPRTKALKP